MKINDKVILSLKGMYEAYSGNSKEEIDSTYKMFMQRYKYFIIKSEGNPPMVISVDAIPKDTYHSHGSDRFVFFKKCFVPYKEKDNNFIDLRRHLI